MLLLPKKHTNKRRTLTQRHRCPLGPHQAMGVQEHASRLWPFFSAPVDPFEDPDSSTTVQKAESSSASKNRSQGNSSFEHRGHEPLAAISP